MMSNTNITSITRCCVDFRYRFAFPQSTSLHGHERLLYFDGARRSTLPLRLRL
jgi:hypothetical protein